MFNFVFNQNKLNQQKILEKMKIVCKFVGLMRNQQGNERK